MGTTNLPSLKTRVKVYHSDGTAEDISERITSGPSVSINIDNSDWQCSMTLDNRQKYRRNNLSLDPTDDNSTLNQDGSSNKDPLLSRYHYITVEKDDGNGWELKFEGWCGGGADAVTVNNTKGEVNFEPYGFLMPLKEYDRLTSFKYEDRDLATNLLRPILLDSDFEGYLSHTVVEDDPNYQVQMYKTKQESTWDVLKKAVEPTGYILRSKKQDSAVSFGDGSGGTCDAGQFYLTLYDPNRDNSTPDHTYSSNERIKRRSIDHSIDDVRSWVQVVYEDRNSGAEKKATPAESDSVRQKFGIPNGDDSNRTGKDTRLHRRIRMLETNRSPIDTAGEAETLQSIALQDLSDPSNASEIQIPGIYDDPTLHDLVRFSCPDYTLDLGITGIEYDLSPGTRGETRIRGIVDKIIGIRAPWIGKELSEEEKLRRSREKIKGSLSDLPSPVIVSERPFATEGKDGSTVNAVKIQWKKVNAWWYGETWVWVRFGQESFDRAPDKKTDRNYVIIKPVPPGKKIYYKALHIPYSDITRQGRR